MNDKDQMFDPSKTETPQVVACIIHPFSKAMRTHTVKEVSGFDVVTFGLCWSCERKSKDKTFQELIDKRICERLEQLKTEGIKNGG